MTETIDESPMNIKNPLIPDNNEQQEFSTNNYVKLSGINRDSNVSTVKNSGSFSHRLNLTQTGQNKFTLKMHDQLHGV
jgi:hypothetical protein